MDDIVYFCRVKGMTEWDRFSGHPGRPFEGVASLYASRKGLIRPVKVEIKITDQDPAPCWVGTVGKLDFSEAGQDIKNTTTQQIDRVTYFCRLQGTTEWDTLHGYSGSFAGIAERYAERFSVLPVVVEIRVDPSSSSPCWTGEVTRANRGYASPREATERMQKVSGKVQSYDPLVTFIYLLTRDHLVPGAVEGIIGEAQVSKNPVLFTNGWLAEYSKDVAGRLRGQDSKELKRTQETMIQLLNRVHKIADERDSLKERENQFWEALRNSYDMETREELEAEAESWNPKNALVVALHQIWKRDPIVTDLMKKQADLFRGISRVLNCGEWYSSACEVGSHEDGVNLENAMREILKSSVNQFGWGLPEKSVCPCDTCRHLHPAAVEYKGCYVQGRCPALAVTEKEALELLGEYQNGGL